MPQPRSQQKSLLEGRADAGPSSSEAVRHPAQVLGSTLLMPLTLPMGLGVNASAICYLDQLRGRAMRAKQEGS